MKCANCPLFTSWNNESDSGEDCGLFGDSWDNAFQYEDKDGNIVGCYIDRNFILRRDAEYEAELERRVQYFLEEEQNGKNHDNLL